MALTALQKLVAGASNFFNPAQPAANASIYDLARADAQRQAMASLGAGLVGAAVPQTPIMRAQALQNAFSNVGNTSANVYNAAQMRLEEQKYLDEKAQQAKLSSALQSALGGTQAPISSQVQIPSVEPVGEFRPLPAAATRLLQPAPPTANLTTQSNALTQAQIQKVRAMEASGDLEGAYKQLADFQYENAQPYKPQGEMGQNIADMIQAGSNPADIDAYRQAQIYGKPEGVLAIALDPRFKAPEFQGIRQTLLDAEVAKAKGQGQPEFLKLVEAYQNMPEGSEAKTFLQAKLQKEGAPEGMRLEFDDTGRIIGVVQGSAPPSGVGEKELNKIFFGNLDTANQAATAAVEEINLNNDLRKTLESGVRFGRIGEAYNAISTELQNIGLAESDDATINTKTYANLASKKTVAILSSGALGSGTGISTRDVDFVKEMALSDPSSYTEEQVLKILEIQDKVSRRIVTNYDKRFNTTIKKLKERGGDTTSSVLLDSYIVNLPEAYRAPTEEDAPEYDPATGLPVTNQ